jgi:hypothetical protein
VGVSLTSAHRSVFASIHSGHPGVDPYIDRCLRRLSDSVRRGQLHRQGHLRRRCFEEATHGRFPRIRCSVTDLIEGTWTRAGLATDIEVYGRLSGAISDPSPAASTGGFAATGSCSDG